MVRFLAFFRGAPIEAMKPALLQNPYDKPIEGLIITVDLNARKVVNISDCFVRLVIDIIGNSPFNTFLSPNPTNVNPPSNLWLKG